MKGLRPGEIKILESLTDGEKRFSDLHRDTGLQFNILSQYLKRLQGLGLVERDIETRRYRIKEISLEALFYNDVLDFMRQRLEKIANYGVDRPGVIYRYMWVVMTESPELRNRIEKEIKHPQNIKFFFRLFQIIEDSWRSSILSRFNQNEREIVSTYKKSLLKYVKRFDVHSGKDERRQVYEEMVNSIKAEMSSDYPRTPIPEKIIYIKAAKRFRRMIKNYEKIIQPRDLEELYRILRTYQDSGQYKKDMTKENLKELKEVWAFLRNPYNKKIYEKYIMKINNPPKTLIFYPSLGFRGYIEKLEALLPQEAKKAKQEEMKVKDVMYKRLKEFAHV